MILVASSVPFSPGRRLADGCGILEELVQALLVVLEGLSGLGVSPVVDLHSQVTLQGRLGQELVPGLVTGGRNVLERGKASLVFRKQEFGRLFQKELDAVKIGVAGPTGIVEGILVVIVPDVQTATIFQTKGQEFQIGSSCGNVHERFSVSIAGIPQRRGVTVSGRHGWISLGVRLLKLRQERHIHGSHRFR